MGSAVGGLASAAGGIAGMAGSSGGGAIPTLDLSKQVGNAQDSYSTATGNAAQTMNTAQALNKQSQSTLNNVTGAQSSAMKAVQDSANTNLQTYGSTFTPLQQQQADQAKNYTSDANVQQLQGKAVADSNSSTQAALDNQRASLAAEGVDPASVHGSALTQQAAITGAAQNAGAATNSYLNTQATGNQLVSQANQLGMQVGAAGTSGAATAAGIGSGIVSDTNNTNNSNVNNLTAANTYLNTGVNANASGANIANTQFQGQQTSYQDQQAAAASKGAGIGGIVSAVAPLALAAMQDGGPVTAYGIPHMAGGGPITSRGAMPHPIVPGTTDTKLIAATPDEFMIPKDVAMHMGHEKLHKLIDKTREEIATRKGIPTAQLSSVHTSRGA